MRKTGHLEAREAAVRETAAEATEMGGGGGGRAAEGKEGEEAEEGEEAKDSGPAILVQHLEPLHLEPLHRLPLVEPTRQRRRGHGVDEAMRHVLGQLDLPAVLVGALLEQLVVLHERGELAHLEHLRAVLAAAQPVLLHEHLHRHAAPQRLALAEEEAVAHRVRVRQRGRDLGFFLVAFTQIVFCHGCCSLKRDLDWSVGDRLAVARVGGEALLGGGGDGGAQLREPLIREPVGRSWLGLGMGLGLGLGLGWGSGLGRGLGSVLEF